MPNSLIGYSRGIVVGTGAAGRCGPGTQPSAVMFDDFTRTVPSGWGTASSGAVWTAHPGAGSVNHVSSGYGALLDANSGGGSQWMSTAVPFAVGTSFTLLARVQYTDTDTILTDWFVGTSGLGVRLSVSVTPGVGANDGSVIVNGAVDVPFTWAANTLYLFEWKYTSGTHLSEARVWLDGGTRPSSPTASDSSLAFTGTTEFDVYNTNVFTASTPAGVLVDYIQFS